MDKKSKKKRESKNKKKGPSGITLSKDAVIFIKSVRRNNEQREFEEFTSSC